MAKAFFRLLLACLIIASATARATAGEEPLRLVQQTSEEVLRLLDTRRTDLEVQPELLFGLIEETVAPRFDFPLIARLAVGRHWRRASSDQQSAFTNEFRRMLILTYARALLEVSASQILYQPPRPSPEPDRTTVPTLIERAGGGELAIDYRLVRRERGWTVYDVVIDGVSLLSSYRSGFNNQIKRLGIEGVIERLRRHNLGEPE